MKKRKAADGELHEIQNKKRSRVVTDKKKGEKRLKPWTKKKRLRALLPVCLIAIFGVSIFALGSFGNVESNVVDDGFVTVCYALPDDDSTPLDHSALENIGYLNARFKGQTNWYSEMHGTTVAAGVSQSVNTFKQYADNALIVADVTSSSLVNAARQFCYAGNEVMWRNGTSYTAASFDEMNAITWKSGEPYAHMTIADFKAKNGLPASELFVYVINETTLLDATEVVDNGDGTYTQTYTLDPATDKAPAHYVNQMKFTGGLTGLPEFSHITLTCTFDSTWQILSVDVDESYKAEMVITVNCSSSFHTEFSYNTPKAESPAFKGYFEQYLGKDISNGPLPESVDCMGCLTSAFLSKPLSLELSLDLNENHVQGFLYFDASKLDVAAVMKGGQINLDAALASIELRAQIGEISLWLEKGDAYISAGDLKTRLSVEELIELINRYTAGKDDGAADSEPQPEGAPVFAIDDPTTEEKDDGFSYVAKQSAVMKARLDLSSLGVNLQIPLNFYFALDEENRATLTNADVSVAVGDLNVAIGLKASDAEVPSLSEADKSAFFDLLPYVDGLAGLFTKETLKAEIAFVAEDFGVSGTVNLAIKDGLRVSGNLLVTVGNAQLPVTIGFEDNTVYANVAGLKVRAGVSEISELVNGAAINGVAESGTGISDILDIVLKNDLLSLLTVSERDGGLQIALRGTELLKLFGVDFALGDVELGVKDGELTASALGASVKLTEGESVTVDKEGYISILPYAEDIIDLFTGEALGVAVKFEQDGLKVAGDLTVNMNSIAVSGTVDITYQEINKSVEIYFGNNTVYLAIDGLKVKADIDTITDLVAELSGEAVALEVPEIDVGGTIETVLSAGLENLLQVSEESGKLIVTINGTELLKLLGLEFELGEVKAEVGSGKIDVSAYGAEIAVTAGTAKTIEGLDEYIDIAPIVPYVGALKDLFTAPVLKAEIGYESETLSLSGELSLALQGGIKLSGTVTAKIGEGSLTANIGYEDETVYLAVAGMKVCGTIDEIMGLVNADLSTGAALDIQKLLDTVLSAETIQNIEISKGDGVLQIALRGTELLKLFGVDFALGDVELGVKDGELTASALGASVKLTEGESVTVDKEGYISILPYAEELIDLFTGEALGVAVKFEQDGLKVAGDLTVNINSFAVSGTVDITYQEINKSVEIYFGNNTVYLAIDGLKVKADIDTITDLVAELTGEAVALEVPEIDVGGTIETVLSAGLENLLQVSEESGKLIVTINGTELLKLLGLEFELGEVKAEVGSGKIDVSALGAEIAVTAGTAKTIEGLDEYIDIAPIVPYVGALKDLFTAPVLKAEIGYETETLSLSSELSLALQGGIKLSGTVTAKIGEGSLTANIGYEDETVYLAVAGMKVCGTIDEIMGLVKADLSTGVALDIQKLLDTVLSAETIQNIEITEGDGALQIALCGTELLKLFGVDFALGDVELGVKDGELTASALGASVKLTEGESVTVDKEGYISILPYAEELIELFTGEALGVAVKFEQDGLKVAGDLTVNMKEGEVFGTVRLTYQSLEKQVGLYFDGTDLYLALDGLKARVSLTDVKELIAQFTGGNLNFEQSKILETICSLDFSEYVKLGEEGQTLQLLVHGTQFLEKLGVDFGLGDVDLSVGNGKLHLDVLGISADVTSGKVWTDSELKNAMGDKEAYVDLGGLLKSVPQIISEKTVSLNGSVTLTAGADIVIGVEQGIVSWANGINAYLDLRVNLGGTIHRVEVSADAAKLKLAYGNVGVELAYADFGDLDAAIVKLYGQVREAADKLLVSSNPMPEQIDGLLDLLDFVMEALDIDMLIDFKNFDLVKFLNELTIGAPTDQNSICTVGFKGIEMELLNADDTRFAGIGISFTDRNMSLAGTVAANVGGKEIPEMPNIEYLGKTAFENLFDYLGAAVATLAETNLQVSITGEVTSSDTEKYPDGKKYTMSGNLNYYAGSSCPINLDLSDKKLWINSDVYLKATFALTAHAEGDQSFYLDLFLLDSDGDGVLDAYASISLLGADSAAYAPLNIYARADELMPVLASALTLLGIDGKTITDYVLSPWLDVETVAQLKALGNELKTMIAGLIGGSQISAQADEQFGAFVSALQIGADYFTVQLPSDVLFGVKGDDLTVKIGKTDGENGSRLNLISVANIYGNNGTEKTSISIGIEATEAERLQPAYENVLRIDGIAALLKTLAKSTTHFGTDIISGESTAHKYVLNRNFYITGDILLNVSLVNIDLNIKPVAFSITIDENGDVGINVRFEYEGVKEIGVTAINGNTVVDLTGKNGMVYIKRVQTTDESKKPLAKPVTVYRSMPLSNFVSDIINQMGFLFNLGDTITSALASIDTSGSTAAPAGEEDIGTLFYRYFKSLEFTSGDAENWTLTLNGAGLMNGMDDIVIKLGADGDGVLRDLSLKAGLTASIITVKISADLQYRNPCGVMDDGVKDITTDVAGILTDAMSYKLDTVDWASVTYLEGEYVGVEYMLAGNVIGTQYVVISTGAEGNDPAGSLYGSLRYPEIPEEYELAGYEIVWKTHIGEGGKLPANRVIEAEYVPLTFCLTFTSDRETEGYTFDEELGLWVLNVDYRYGEAFALPFAETQAERIAYFVDEAGNRYASLDGWTMESTVFRAVWEQIEYSATFVTDGSETVVKGYFGDAVAFPESPEKVGYRFAGWSVNGAVITELILTQNVTVTAEFVPVTVSVILVSDMQASGFTEQDGKFVKTVLLTYGAGAVELPTERNTSYALTGYCDESGNMYYRVENLTEGLTLYAVWEEIGYTVTFLGEDGSIVKTLNARAGEKISVRADLPAVPSKTGYSGAWNFGGDIVSGDMTVRAEYTAKEYTVTVVSGLPYDGFAASDDGYEKIYRYTYDGAAVELEALGNVSGYWFKGYYTQENGKGESITSVSGITENVTLYVWWQDNTVTVRLYSDIKYDNSQFDPNKNGYYTEVKFNDDYTLDYVPVVAGYQQLGWWHEENEAWSPVNNVEQFYGQSSVEIWSVWIQNIDVEITDFSINRATNGFSVVTYNIMGVINGGNVVVGKSSKIFPKEPDRSVQFVVYFNNVRDPLSGGDEIVIEGNTFRKLKMTCGNAGSTLNTAPYGGAKITHTFTYTDASGNKVPVSTHDEHCISLETFRYRFYNEAGEICNTVDIRGVYGKEVRLLDYLPEVPAKVGHSGHWDIDSETVVDSGARNKSNQDKLESINKSEKVVLYTTDVRPDYIVNRYAVRLESDAEVGLDGWTQSGDKYVYDCEVDYGAIVSFICENNTILTYTVGIENNVFTMPALDEQFIWNSIKYSATAIKCFAQRNVDTVIYISEEQFTYCGGSYTTYSEDLTEGYSLIVPDNKEGYTFIGWYMENNGVWEEATAASLQKSSGTKAVTYSLHALWLSDLSVVLSNVKRSGIGSNKYTATATITGGELIGAFAKEEGVKAQTTYIYFVNNTETATTKDDRGYIVAQSTENKYWNEFSINEVKKDKKSYLHVAVKINYTYDGKSVTDISEATATSNKF